MSEFLSLEGLRAWLANECEAGREFDVKSRTECPLCELVRAQIPEAGSVVASFERVMANGDFFCEVDSRYKAAIEPLMFGESGGRYRERVSLGFTRVIITAGNLVRVIDDFMKKEGGSHE